ncbi:hypothetical protein [Solidesulfovibrio alcoholivorans]|uniref:hypothetical protein n=1 Tax=Solidesulfovibrio alcoholivorans TaxID=81406 RepID=UPI0004981CDF|nr:hypothetical protein [Solidesulfovibrio alcoholivorans]
MAIFSDPRWERRVDDLGRPAKAASGMQGGKVAVHPILAKRIEHAEKLKVGMETKRQEYGEAVAKYVEAKANLERTEA